MQYNEASELNTSGPPGAELVYDHGHTIRTLNPKGCRRSLLFRTGRGELKHAHSAGDSLISSLLEISRSDECGFFVDELDQYPAVSYCAPAFDGEAPLAACSNQMATPPASRMCSESASFAVVRVVLCASAS